MNDADRVANAARMLVEAAGMRTAEENIRNINERLIELSGRVTNDSRQFEMDIESLRRQHDALDKRVALLAERMGDLASDVAELKRRTAPESSDDDPLDLDALPVGTMLRDRKGDWWYREPRGWRVLPKPGDPIPGSFLPADRPSNSSCGPFTVVHRG